jgi:hypothetical protein
MDNKKLVEITVNDVDCKINLKKHNLVTTYNEKNELVITVIHNNIVIDVITIPNSNIYGKKLRHRL